jgi:hypothetical protein
MERMKQDETVVKARVRILTRESDAGVSVCVSGVTVFSRASVEQLFVNVPWPMRRRESVVVLCLCLCDEP